MAATLTLTPQEFRREGRALSDWDAVVREEESRQVTLAGPIVIGLLTLVLGIGGFFVWASLTPMSSAAMASGHVIVESNTKTVTQLEAGTLAELLVREGETVTEGQVLARLDVTRSQSTLTQLRQQHFAATVQLARLDAEKDNKADFTFVPPAFDHVDTTAVEQIVATERRLFAERSNLYNDQIAADQASIDQVESQRTALLARRQSWIEQAEVIGRDHDTLAKLEKKKLVTRADLNTKTIQLVEVQSRIAETDAALAENTQKKAQLELALTNRRTDHYRAISEQIQATRAEVARVRQAIVAAEDVVAKAAIRAPQSGIIANIKIRTPGSAVIPGQPVLDIVPADQPMLIEGKANAMDIDTIHVGERTEIRLSAFGDAEETPLLGTVTYVAPDGVLDERTGQMTYVFRAKIDEESLRRQSNLFLYPGMAADIYIVNAERTALAYLLDPVRKSFNRAFREQ